MNSTNKPKPKYKPKPKSKLKPEVPSEGASCTSMAVPDTRYSPVADSDSDMEIFDISTRSQTSVPSTEVSEQDMDDDFLSRRKRKRRADFPTDFPGSSVSDDLIRKAVEFKESLTAYCLNQSLTLSKEQTECILKHVNGLTEIVSNLSVENARLRGRLDERTDIIRTFSKVSYADAARVVSMKPKVPSLSKVNKPVKKAQQVVIIRPVESMQLKSSDETKKEVMKYLNPREQRIKVKHFRKIRENSILIETDTKEDLEKIVECPELKERGFKMETPGKRGPRILIYDIQKSLSEQEVKDAIYDQNSQIAEEFEKENFNSSLKLLFRVGKRRDDVVNWVAEVSPNLRNKIRKIGRVYIEWQCCKIQDFIGLSRCYKCQGFGHVAKYCRQERSTCGHCAEDGHKASECSKKSSNPKCPSCKRANKSFAHSIFDKSCPAYKFALEKVINKIDYGV